MGSTTQLLAVSCWFESQELLETTNATSEIIQPCLTGYIFTCECAGSETAVGGTAEKRFDSYVLLDILRFLPANNDTLCQ